MHKQAKISDLHLHSLRTAGAHGAALQSAALVFAQAAPDAIILIGVQCALEACINHLAGTAYGLGLFNLIVCGTGVAHREEQFRILVTTCGLGSPIKSVAQCLPPLKALWLM